MPGCEISSGHVRRADQCVTPAQNAAEDGVSYLEKNAVLGRFPEDLLWLNTLCLVGKLAGTLVAAHQPFSVYICQKMIHCNI